mgnify:CR=1 FL=1
MYFTLSKILGFFALPSNVVAALAAVGVALLFTRFWRAEDYHLQYYRKHPNESYIAHVTRPEIERFRKDFPGLLK